MASWSLVGNRLGTPPKGILGTTDTNALVIETNGQERLRVDASGNLGIGTTTPSYPLHMSAGKTLRIEGGTNAADTTNYFSFGGNGTFGIDAPGVANGRFVVNNSGFVGIGVSQPVARLDVAGGVRLSGNRGDFAYLDPGSLAVIDSVKSDIGPVVTLTNTAGGVRAAAAIDFYTFNPGHPDGTIPSAEILAIDVGNFANDIVFQGNRPGAANQGFEERLRIMSTGELTAPGGLRIKGDVTVSGDVLLAGADCAEQFNLSEVDIPEPGTVLVIDQGGALRESREAYDKKVAGVVSGAGDYRHGILLDNRSEFERRVPVALTGKVYCKVDAQHSPIEVGDLLTTSPTPGHAMKAIDPEKAFGSVIGKALGPLSCGQALIPILVALQ